MVVTLFLILVAFALSPASATCTGDRTSFPLSVTNDTEGAACAPGFYCPHLDPSNRSTWPVMCAVSPKCQVDRLSGSICTKRDDVDIFEPRICKERFFCPTFREQRECPEGHYCVVGTQRPVPCPLLSPCPAGSLRPLPLFPVVLALAVTCLVAAVFVVYHRALRRKLPASSSIFDLRSNEVMASLNGSFDGLSQMVAEDVAKSEWVSGTHLRQEVKDSELTSEPASESGIDTVPVPFTDNTPSPRETPLDGSSPFCVEDVGASTLALPAAPTVALIRTRRRVNPPSASSSPNGGSPVQQPTRPVPAPIRKSFTFLPPPALKNANNKEVSPAQRGEGPSASGDLGARPSTRQAPMAIDDDYDGPSKHPTVDARATHTPELHSAPGARCVPNGPEHEDSTGGWFVPRSSDAATSPFRLTGSFNSPASVGDVHKSAQRLQRVMSGEIDPGALLRDRVLARHLPSMQTLLDAFNRTRGERAPIQIDATDVTVTMPDGKVLLHGVNGTMQPGKVTAIMGPTGAGKTMFMTTLLGGVDPAWHVGGTLKVNGEPVRFGGIRRQIGFVPQDDVLHTELTVDGNLYYSSEMRLPKEWTADERARLREAVIQQLRLDDGRQDVVGAVGTAGSISASQRKRVSVGVELASAPLVLFLDEPTSGLDSTTSLELVRLLKDIALAVRLTVVMVVHQPRVEIWDELDEVLLLAPGGRTVFQGSQAAATQHFIAHGARITPHDNPADVIMDTIAANADRLISVWTGADDDDKSLWATETSGASNNDPDRVLLTTDAIRQETTVEKAAEVERGMKSSQASNGGSEWSGDRASFPRQVLLTHLRSVEKQLASPVTLITEVGVMVLCGSVIGFSNATRLLTGVYNAPYDRISPVPFNTVFPQISFYMLMALGLAASVAGVNVFGRERAHCRRDTQAGMSQAAYFIGTATSSMYRVMFASLWFTAAILGVGKSVVAFPVLYGALVLGYFCYYAIAATASVVFTLGLAPLMAGQASIAVSVFSGAISFPAFAKRLFFTFHIAQVVQEENYQPVKHWTTSAMSHDYETGKAALSFGVVAAWLVVLNAVAFVALLFSQRRQH